MHDSSMGTPSRIARYSGSERPACRMNQTGVRSTGSRRAARTRSLVRVALVPRVAAGGGGGLDGGRHRSILPR